MKHPRSYRNSGPDPDANVLLRADIAVAEQTMRYRDHPAVRAVVPLSKLSDQPPLLAVAAGVLGWGLLIRDRRLARRGGHLLVSVLIATGLKDVLKRSISRTRPELLDQGLHAIGTPGSKSTARQSFPSGHTASGVAFALAAAKAWPTAAPVAYAGAALVTLVQLPRGSHYPTDLLAGIAIGLAAQAIASRLVPPRPA